MRRKQFVGDLFFSFFERSLNDDSAENLGTPRPRWQHPSLSVFKRSSTLRGGKGLTAMANEL
jgi:hypothetical protein